VRVSVCAQINFGINDNQPSFETIASIVYHDIVHDIPSCFSNEIKLRTGIDSSVRQDIKKARCFVKIITPTAAKRCFLLMAISIVSDTIRYEMLL